MPSKTDTKGRKGQDMTWHTRWRRFRVLRNLLMLGTLATSAVAQTAPALVTPPETVRAFLDDALAYLQFDDAEKANLFQGKILFTGMPSQEKLPQQLSIAGAMLLVQRPMAEVIEAYLDDMLFTYNRDILAYRQLTGSASVQSGDDVAFADVQFTAEEAGEVKKLLRVKPGNTFNLSVEEMALFRAIDRKAATAAAQVASVYQRVLRARYQSYLRTGHQGIQPYAHDEDAHTWPGRELAVAKESMWLLQTYFPAFYHSLMHFPKTTDPTFQHRFYWEKTMVKKRPAFILSHHTYAFSDHIAFMAEEKFYVSHTYNSSLTLLGAVPHDKGTLVLGTVRLFSNRVAGAMQGLKHKIGRKRVGKQMARRFEELRTGLEQNSQHR